MAGSKIPNYCVMSDTANVARVIEKMGEGMKIHISGTSKDLLDKVGGFRCEYRGVLDLGVSSLVISKGLIFICDLFKPKRGQIESFWLIGPDKEPEAELPCHMASNVEKELVMGD